MFNPKQATIVVHVVDGCVSSVSSTVPAHVTVVNYDEEFDVFDPKCSITPEGEHVFVRSFDAENFTFESEELAGVIERFVRQWFSHPKVIEAILRDRASCTSIDRFISDWRHYDNKSQQDIEDFLLDLTRRALDIVKSEQGAVPPV